MLYTMENKKQAIDQVNFILQRIIERAPRFYFEGISYSLITKLPDGIWSFVGLRLKASGNTIHWFKYMPDMLVFDHSYCQASGKTYGKSSRAWRYRIKIKEKVERVLMVNPTVL